MQNTPSKPRNWLPKLLLALLVIEFLFGTLAGLYQEVPEGPDKYDVYKPAGFIFFHVLVATALFVLGLVYTIRTKKQNESKKAFGASIGGLSCITLALIFGAIFVETANDIYTFLMMFFALGALLSYAQIVFRKQ